MRFGIHYRLWSPAWSDADLDLIPRARDLGYSAFEITVSNLAQINANAIRQRAEAAGMEIVATLSLAKDRALATPDPAVRRQAIAFLGAAVERVREMNCRLLVGMLYGTPGLFTGKAPTADELRWIAEGVRQTAEFAKACGMTLALEPVNRYEDGFVVFQGNQIYCGVSLLAGADGLVPGHANVWPELLVGMYEAAQRKETEAVWSAQARLNALMTLRGRAVIHTYKVIAHALGLMSDTVAAPLPRLSAEEAKQSLVAHVAVGVPIPRAARA
jgi:hypothetical protein